MLLKMLPAPFLFCHTDILSRERCTLYTDGAGRCTLICVLDIVGMQRSLIFSFVLGKATVPVGVM
jgi:hypothetical protein